MTEIERKEKEQKEQEEERIKGMTTAGITSGLSDTIQRYGSGVNEWLDGYDSLKSISEQKINPAPEYHDMNIKQHAGNAAEQLKATKDNVEHAIKGENTRTVRTADHPDFGKNDPKFDHIELRDGKVIDGSGSQMKFVEDPKALVDKIACGEGGGKNDLSRYQDIPLDLPSEQVAEVKQHCADKAQEFRKQAEHLEREGKHELATETRKQAEQYEKLKDNIRDGKSTREEAIYTTLHPKMKTALEIAQVSNRAGLQGAASGALIGGGMSTITNVVAVLQGKKDSEEAIKDVVKSTAGAAAQGYATAFLGSALKGVMQNAGDAFIRTLSKTGLPGMIATTALETGKTLVKWFKGDIDGVECLTELGEKGAGMASSTLMAAIGQILIPIPVVGGIVGGMIGYALSSAFYRELVTSLKGAQLAREERIRIEKESEQAISMIRQYRAEVERDIANYLSDYISTFRAAFDDIKSALNIGDIDGFIAGANAITCKLGGKPQFNNFSEFNSLMESDEAFSL